MQDLLKILLERNNQKIKKGDSEWKKQKGIQQATSSIKYEHHNLIPMIFMDSK